MTQSAEECDVLGIIERFAGTLEEQGTHVAKIVLFGSYATGRYRDGSDIDVVVISEDFAGKDYWERLDIIVNAVYEVWKPIEARALTPLEWERGESMVVELAKDGEVVYKAEPVASK